MLLNLFRSIQLSHSVNNLQAYREIDQPTEVITTNRDKIYTYGTGFLQAAMSASGIKQEEDLEMCLESMCDCFYWGSWKARGETSD